MNLEVINLLFCKYSNVYPDIICIMNFQAVKFHQLCWLMILMFKCSRWFLERQLDSSQAPKEEKINLLKDLERKETEYIRLKRHKICVDDFELLTIIGRGAFGEVELVFPPSLYFSLPCSTNMLLSFKYS